MGFSIQHLMLKCNKYINMVKFIKKGFLIISTELIFFFITIFKNKKQNLLFNDNPVVRFRNWHKGEQLLFSSQQDILIG